MSKKDVGKSWQTLAQISIILAGFLFASAGIMYSGAINVFSTMPENINVFLDVDRIKLLEERNNQTETDSYYNLLNESMNSVEIIVEDQMNVWFYLSLFGSFFVLFSFCCWARGHYLIQKHN